MDAQQLVVVRLDLFQLLRCPQSRQVYFEDCLLSDAQSEYLGSEEGGEVAKECHKSLRFGLDDQVTMDPHGPRGTTGPSNRAKIRTEFIQMLGVYQMLVKAGVLELMGQGRGARYKLAAVVIATRAA